MGLTLLLGSEIIFNLFLVALKTLRLLAAHDMRGKIIDSFGFLFPMLRLKFEIRRDFVFFYFSFDLRG